MSRHTFLNCASDIQWLRDNHIPDLPLTVKSAVLYGNEDSPERVDTYTEINPSTDDPLVMYLETNGKLIAEGGMLGYKTAPLSIHPSDAITLPQPSWREHGGGLHNASTCAACAATEECSEPEA